MPKTFDPDTELPDLSGKVIVVTGGTNYPFHKLMQRSAMSQIGGVSAGSFSNGMMYPFSTRVQHTHLVAKKRENRLNCSLHIHAGSFGLRERDH